MKCLRRTLGAAAALLTATTALSATTAQAAHIGCGDTITRSTVLHADIGPCPNGGVVIGADGVTLDLNGHRIFGLPGTDDGVGVDVFRRVGVRVVNGTVHDFDIGVAIEGGRSNTVENIVARDNYGRSNFSRGGDGIAILSSTNNRIINNWAINNGPFSGIGIYSRIDSNHRRQTTGLSTDNLIKGNQVIDNFRSRSGRPDASDTDNDGIRLENESHRNRIVDNTVTGSGLDGIAIFADNFDNVIQNNYVADNGLYRTAIRRGSGIIVFNRSLRTIVDGNTVTGNADNGITIRGPLFGTVPGATDNTIRANTSVGNVVRPTLPSPVFGPAFDLHDGDPNCDNNRWVGNRYGTANPVCTTFGGRQVA